MSSTALIEFKNGIANEIIEYKNSWGGAARIWDSLFESYIIKKHEYDSWLTASTDGRLWKIWEDERVSNSERLVYLFTCDDALVKHGDFKALATALREFAIKHPRPGMICHLEAWAKVFDESDADMMGLHATSVCDDPWFKWNEETNEHEPYNITKGEKHWFITDRLKEFHESKTTNVQNKLNHDSRTN